MTVQVKNANLGAKGVSRSVSLPDAESMEIGQTAQEKWDATLRGFVLWPYAPSAQRSVMSAIGV